ncbi:InlB B-repeat-containing protein [Enorma massiliensis]|uniref:InlB B-repeat-containing protein n=1 Tax=Enorma massiliensis TaxID=1472761 RepID=UPI003A922023
MKFNGKHIAITAGLGAVLALSPVVGPMATAFAQSNNGAAATQAAFASVAVYINGANYGNWQMPDQAGIVSDNAKGDVPAGQEFLGTWTVVWQDGNTTAGKSLDELAGNWDKVVSITAEYKTVEQGGGEEEPEQPAEQINVTFTYDNTSVATVADENGNIDAAGLGLPENYTWSWTDSQGNVHEFGSDLLASYIFKESCTVTGVPAEDPEEPVDPEDPVNEYIKVRLVDTDGTLIREVVVQNGTSNWSGVLTDPEKDGYVFVGWQQEGASDIVTDLESLVIAADDTVNEVTFTAVWKEATPEQREIKVNYYDGDELLGTGSVFNGTSQWSGVVSPEKDGYTFLGWKFEGDDAVYTDAQLDNLVYAADESVTEVNLYAQWEQVPEDARYVTVHFYDEFGTYLGDGAVLNGTSDWSGPIDAPELDGYTFLGWAEEGGSVYSPELLGQVVVSVPDDVTELTYIAHYEKTPATQTHKVTFDDCLESTKNQVVEVADGETVARPADPVCEGWTFLGWYTDTQLTQEFDFSTPVTADMTLCAKWQQNAEQPGEGATDDGADDTTSTETPTAAGETMPQTSDLAGIAVAATGAAGAGLAGIGAILGKKRR